MNSLNESTRNGSGDSSDVSGHAAWRHAWTSSPEYRKALRFSYIPLIVGFSFGLWEVWSSTRAAHLPFVSNHLKWSIQWPYLLQALIAVTLGQSVGRFILTYYKQRYEDRQLAERQVNLAGAEARLAEIGELDLPSLWQITQKRLDLYHEIATGQARRSFRNAQIAMSVGLLILAAAIGLSLDAKTTVASIVTGTLGGVGAALSGYIGRTFIRAQESTAEHLQSYFLQPLEFSRFLAAERLLDTMQGDARDVAAQKLVQQIAHITAQGEPTNKISSS